MYVRTHLGWTILTLAATSIGAFGCVSSPTSTPTDQGGFVSDNPQVYSNFGEGDTTGSSGGAEEPGPNGTPDGTEPGTDPERVIAEADIIQIADNKLYALSQFSGLSIIDISVRDELKLLGRYQLSGLPFEMYLRDNVVYAMFSSWGQYVYDEAADNYSWIQTSHVEALDVTQPSNIASIGAFDLPGAISDSRIVGDVLYTVTYEDGYCWGCGVSPNTTITSLSVANPASVAIVDQLSYADDDPYGYGWRRSVTVTPDRMYVAGIEWNGQSEGHSTIQVIDISDPTGILVQGASVEAIGQIQSRWQMDEYQGVLRVISQPGVWWTDGVPAVQTFSIVSSQQLQPLGLTYLQLPMPETLRTVRFDETRAYAITAVQTDPLFTIDLSNPAQPKQLGELVMPGWVYHIEPRGDRLLALGFDNANPQGSLNVSLFDVSDMTQPLMLQRVAFGGDWSNVAEDQDRIHKAFTILDDLGLILVPYSGWDYDANDYCGSYQSGIQLIDFTQSTLTKRGVASSRGQARRAFVHDERLFAVSDEQVRTFNMDNRDAPLKSTELALATVVNQSALMGDLVLRLSADWWTTEARLEVVNASDPGQAEALGSLDLKALISNQGQDACYYWGFGGAKLLTHDQYAYLVWPSANDWSKTSIAVIDVSDETLPKIVGQLDIPGSFYDYYGYYGDVISSGDTVVQSGSTLVLRHTEGDSYDPATLHKAWLEVVDLSQPSNPVHAATVPLPDAAGHTSLRIDGTTVLTSHWIPLQEDNTKARFYLDRIDVIDPSHPVALPPVNVPGSLLMFNGDTNQLLTVDYKRTTVSNVHYDDCYEKFGWNASFEPTGPMGYDGPGVCKAMRRAFKLLDVSDSTAVLRDTSPIQDGTYISSVFVGDNRVFVPANNADWYDETDPYSYGYRLMVLGGTEDGTLISTLADQQTLAYAYPVAADGTRLVTVGYGPNVLSVIDATDIDNIRVEQKDELAAYVYQVTIADDLALCSLGQFGMQVVDLSQ